MKRTTVFVEEALEAELRAVAERQGRPMAAVVREAMERYVAQQKRRRGLRLGFLAVGRSGRRDTAEKHEEILFHGLDQPSRRSAPVASRRRR